MVCVSCGKQKEKNDDIVQPAETETAVSDNLSPEVEVKKLHVTHIMEGTKSLGNQAGNSYLPVNMFDGDPSTGWAIKLSNATIKNNRIYGPSFDVNAKKLAYVKIQNGYAKNKDSFNKNTRAAWIEIYRDEAVENPSSRDIIYRGPLEDNMELQELQLNPDFDNSRPTRQVQVRFKAYSPDLNDNGYYMGDKYDDLVISEIEFYGLPNEEATFSTPDITLKTLADAFNNKKVNFGSIDKGQIKRVMELLGFTFVGSQSKKIRLETIDWDSEEDRYNYIEGRQYEFENSYMGVKIDCGVYDTHSFIDKMILNFNTQEDCNNFILQSKAQMGSDIKNITFPGSGWNIDTEGKRITIRAYYEN